MNETKTRPLEIITGWQAIADLMDVSPATARKYAKEFGAPVRRMGKRKQAPVYMLVKEFNEWVDSKPFEGKGD